jgi:glycerophosphoryl diester phosphodiesterase
MSCCCVVSPPVVEAHRGASADYPENTLCAFQAAIVAGARWIELDIHECASGELVVMHDTTVDRTTNGTGTIAEMTLAELRALDAGAWRGDRFAGEVVPTLKEVLAMVRPSGTCLNVEVKRFAQPAAATRLAELLRAYAPTVGGSHVVSSFELEALLQVRAADATVPLAFLSSKAGGVRTAIANRFPWVHLHTGAVSTDTVSLAHAAGVKVMTWTMDNASHFAHYARLGVDKVCSNRPAAMLAAREGILA